MKTDEQIQHDVIEELKWDPSVNASDIGVSVKDAVVTLSGNVPSFAEKLAAEQAAWRVAGVRAVAEEVEVQLPGSHERNDREVAEAALSAIKWNVQVPEVVKVTVEKGWVTLKGQVDWEYQRTAAANAVRYLTGVKGLTNLISLKPKVESKDIKTRIEKALQRAATEDARKITVQTKEGTVVLSGKVRSAAEIQDAKWAAWSAPGVRAVECHLTVS